MATNQQAADFLAEVLKTEDAEKSTAARRHILSTLMQYFLEVIPADEMVLSIVDTPTNDTNATESLRNMIADLRKQLLVEKDATKKLQHDVKRLQEYHGRNTEQVRALREALRSQHLQALERAVALIGPPEEQERTAPIIVEPSHPVSDQVEVLRARREQLLAHAAELESLLEPTDAEAGLLRILANKERIREELRGREGQRLTDEISSLHGQLKPYEDRRERMRPYIELTRHEVEQIKIRLNALAILGSPIPDDLLSRPLVMPEEPATRDTVDPPHADPPRRLLS